ncbi:adhesion G protein-coupled receptor F5-like [Boleophthalmus pectinirostris]|uniref:adhesion G protein-coupled receptor F5-like n=1 Tax=Boleophthalmus pectinirostris TaxID=150288 RepID=UPI00242E4CD5|nr:adhesion G protein-coupled receptor F5-like [Boleophthalmus pectinirostris]
MIWNMDTRLEMLFDYLNQNVSYLQKEDQITATTILAVVDILKETSVVRTNVTARLMKNVLKTVDVLVSEEAFGSWHSLSPNSGFNATSNLLRALEDLSASLEGEISISTPHIQLKKSSFNRPYTEDLSPTVYIEIPGTQRDPRQTGAFITTMTFSTLGALTPSPVLPYSDNGTIKTDVVLVTVPYQQIHDVDVRFKMKTFSSSLHRCVHWDHKLKGWTDNGCYTKRKDDSVFCNCSRLSSFSVLDTYIHIPFREYGYSTHVLLGAGVNAFCILICFLLEGCFWNYISTNPTSLMRHVTIINTALCLLVEDCILISLSYDSPPLLMATITVAFTAPQGLYVTEDGLCLLVKGSSKTFLYLAVPVLTIVLANFVPLSVVLSRIVRNSRAVFRVANGKLLVMASRRILLVILMMVWMLEIHVTTPQNLSSAELKVLVEKLSQNVTSLQKEVHNSASTILSVVDILKVTSAVITEVTAPIMENVLKTVDVLVSEEAFGSWHSLSPNSSFNATSNLLRALEDLSASLEGEISISTPHIQLKKSSFNGSYTEDLSPTVSIEIPGTQRDPRQTGAFITTMTFSTLGALTPSPVLPYSDNGTINTDVVLVTVPQLQIREVHVRFKMKTFSTSQHLCVLWKHDLRGGVGSWHYKICYTNQMNETVVCNCSRPGAFSVLNTHTPMCNYVNESYYFGAVVNVFCILICLLVEGCFWKSIRANTTCLMRHVTIINMAICELLEDGIFALSFHKPDIFLTSWKCSYLVYFWHFFCVSLLSWMLVSSLLLFCKTSLTVPNMSNVKMLTIGFAVGYGVPLLLATFTIATTAPQGEYVIVNFYDLCLPNFCNEMTLLSFLSYQ